MKRSVHTKAYTVCSGFSHLSLFRSRFLFPPPSLFTDQRMGARTACWGCTAGLRYAVPCETLDQMVLLRTVLNFSVLAIFLVFGLSVPPSERVVPRRFFQSYLSKMAFCVFLFSVTAYREIKPCGNLHLLYALGSGEQ